MTCGFLSACGCHLARSFPATHVVFRLVALTSGWWPSPDTAGGGGGGGSGALLPVGSEGRIARAVLAACNHSITPCLRCFELLLARRATDVPETELSPVGLRLVRVCA
jgi:hypothetical protein